MPGTLDLGLAWPVWGCWGITSTGLVPQEVWLLNDMGWAHVATPGSCLPPSSDSSHGSSLMSHWMGAGLSHTVSLPGAHLVWSQGSLSDFQGLSLTLCKVETQFTFPLPRVQKEGPWRSDLGGQCQGTWEKLDRGLLSARELLRKQEWGRSGSYRNI